MNAVSYLVSRKAICPFKISLGLFIGTGLAWLNSLGAEWLDSSSLFSDTFNWVPGVFMVFTAIACGCLVLGAIGAPIHEFSQFMATIKRFTENRILDELTSTGLSTRSIFHQLLLYHLKRAAVISVPSGLLWFAIVGGEFLLLSALSAVLFLVISAVATCLSCWNTSVGARGKFFLLAPLVFLFGPPAILFQFAAKEPSFWLGSAVFVIAASYFLSIRALEARHEFKSMSSKLRRIFRLKRKSSRLSENAIVARQEAVGREWGDILYLTVSALALLFAMYTSVSIEAHWPVLNLLLFTGFVAAWRAAANLSQSLTSELEGSTLEILRTTPFGSDRFLKGWLDLTLKPLFVELAVLCTAAFAFALASFPFSLLDGTFIFCVVMTFVMPYVGALFGASIAGQLKTRSEVSGQLGWIMLFVGGFSVPQMSALLVADHPIWLNLVMTLMLAKVACWLLKAGATKSLNRVFLPQK